MTKFKELRIGQRFEFDRSDLSVAHGLADGPWRKISARKYIRDTNPFRVCPFERMEHALVTGFIGGCQVVSINVPVIPQ